MIDASTLSVYAQTAMSRKLGAWTDISFPTGSYFIFFSGEENVRNDVHFWNVLHGTMLKRIRVAFLNWKEVEPA